MDNEPTPPAASADPRVAEAWRDHRQRLMDVAYRMLGSVRDAGQHGQESPPQLVRHGVDGRADVRGWLVRGLSAARRSAARRGLAHDTSYVGPWLPEPV